MFALCVAELVCCLESTMINIALTELYRIYGDPVRVGWILTAFTIPAASSAVIGGRLGDIYGRRRVLLGLLMVACTGSLISASSADLNVIICGRMLQGVSMGILPLCYGLLKELGNPKQVATGIGLLGGVYAGGVAVGLLLGGLVVDEGHWQGIFIVSAANAVLAIILVLMIVPVSKLPRQIRRIDYWGAILLAPAIALPFLAFDRMGKLGWTASEPWILLAVGVGLTIVWVMYEKRHPDPLVDLRQLKARPIVAANLSMLITYAGPALFAIVMLPILTQPRWTVIGLGLTATAAAMLKIPCNIFCGFSGALNGFLTTRFGAPRVAAVASLVMLVTWALLLFEHGSIWVIAFAMTFLLATPLVLLFAALTTIILAESSSERATEVTGVLQVSKSIGYAIGTQMIALILSRSIVRLNGSAFPSEGAYMHVFVYCAALCGITIIIILNATSRRSRTVLERVQAAPIPTTSALGRKPLQRQS
jgi:MFS family permease